MKQHTYTKSKRGRSAFTLIEIMVATVIMVVLVGLVIQITSEVLKVWNRSSGKLSANAEARIALDLLTQDLETAVFRNNKMRWLEAETKIFPSSIAGFEPQTINLILFSPALDRPKDKTGAEIPGDICAVQYELVYQDPVTGDTSDKLSNMFALHRRVIDPATTFADLMGAGNQENFDSWSESGLTPSAAANVNVDPYEAPDEPENYLAGHIANFRVDFFVINSAGDEVKVPSPIKFGGQTTGTPPTSSATVGANAINADYRYPLAYAEISLTVLSDEGTQLLQALQDGRGGTGYSDGKDVVREHGEVFTRRVNFLARPL